MYLAKHHSPFCMELQRHKDIPIANLVQLHELELKSQTTYSLDLVAQVKGCQPPSATSTSSLLVLDVNDHSPVLFRVSWLT